MLFSPLPLSLTAAAIAVAIVTLGVFPQVVRIILFWDRSSASESQLMMERSLWLLSAFVSLALPFSIAGLFLFIHTADALHVHVTGAMCAAGTLAASVYGYPLLATKVGLVLFGGSWLIVSRGNRQETDIPFARKMAWLLVGVTFFAVMDAALSLLYFSDLTPRIITSCCGSLFDAGARTVTGLMSALPETPSIVILLGGMLLLFISGLASLLRSGAVKIYALLNLLLFVPFLAVVVSYISPMLYEMPDHRCPFCMVQEGYGYIGYLLYAGLFAAVTAATGGMLAQRKDASPAPMRYVRRTMLFSLFSWGLFALVLLYIRLTTALLP